MHASGRAPFGEGALERLRAAADSTGWLRFDRYMEISLYTPRLGYYARADRTLGREGDFYTAAHVSPLFGATLAERARLAWARAGRPARFTLVELGPGDGTLAADLLDALVRDPPGESAWEYVLIDRSAPLRARARARAEGAARTRFSIQEHSALSEEAPFTGFLFANELLDAIPVRRFRFREGRWSELGLDTAADLPREVERDLPSPGEELELPPGAAEGATLELSPLQEAQIREVADAMEAGEAVFLDYGADESRWTAHPGPGTLAAWKDHRELPDPITEPGSADLSAFVNFGRVRAAARRAGLVELAFRRQSEALGAWGYPTLLASGSAAAPTVEERVRLQLASKNLLFGFENFYALELASAPPS